MSFLVSDKTPEKHYSAQNDTKTGDGENVIQKLKQYLSNHCIAVLKSTSFPDGAVPSHNGFVDTVVECYSRHHNLVIRPDDIWATIMTQFSFYINNHAEEFRKFLCFEANQNIHVTIPGFLHDAPYELGVKLLIQEIDRNLVDPELRKWILPDFSTTTDNDLVSIGVVFMASVNEYFDKKASLDCGIPNVTLEGTVEDWENIHDRLEKLKEYKLEKWYEMLQPVMKQFVAAKQEKVDLDFWQKICHYICDGSGSSVLSGWITVFCVFDRDGNWQANARDDGGFALLFMDKNEIEEEKKLKASLTKWPRIDAAKVPAGIVEVDVKINDNGCEHNTVLIAGHVAIVVKDDGFTLQPTLGWAIALKSTK